MEAVRGQSWRTQVFDPVAAQAAADRDWQRVLADVARLRAEAERPRARRTVQDPSREAGQDPRVVGVSPSARPSASAVVRWPWPSLDALTGGMAPGTVHYVIAYSGGGKSTFLRSAVLRWAEQGVPVDVLPLEEPPDVYKTQLACHAAGYDPGPILSGDVHRDINATAILDAVDGASRAMEQDLWYDAEWLDRQRNPVRVDGAEGLTLARLTEACEIAAGRKAKIVLVDHVDHLTTDGRGMYEESVAVNRGALRLAQKHELVLILASQANQQALQGSHDHLAKYAPLRDNHVAMGGHKRTIASSMLSLFRPLRSQEIGESSEAFAQALKRARSGDADPQTVLAPGQVGVSLMKSRAYGAREGKRVILRWRRGSVIEPGEDE